MFIFNYGSSKKRRVTKTEMKKITRSLAGKLDRRERKTVEQFFAAHLDEKGIQSGIDREEFEQTMQILEESVDNNVLEDSDLEHVRTHFEKHLAD